MPPRRTPASPDPTSTCHTRQTLWRRFSDGVEYDGGWLTVVHTTSTAPNLASAAVCSVAIAIAIAITITIRLSLRLQVRVPTATARTKSPYECLEGEVAFPMRKGALHTARLEASFGRVARAGPDHFITTQP
jgi:hypothetical protein